MSFWGRHFMCSCKTTFLLFDVQRDWPSILQADLFLWPLQGCLPCFPALHFALDSRIVPREGEQHSRWTEFWTFLFLYPILAHHCLNQLTDKATLEACFLHYPTALKDHVLLLGRQNVLFHPLSCNSFQTYLLTKHRKDKVGLKLSCLQ